MSEAILTFQVQLSGVMETVLKSAMYEITRLVEDSFLEEVARSKQEVESLRQRLQWWESRRREREGGGRARCADCGRAGVPGEGAHITTPPAPPAEELKQERALGGDWSSCPGEASKPGPLNALEEAATPSPVGVPEMHTAAPIDLEGGESDPLLKEEELQETRSGGDVQGKWLLCSDGELWQRFCGPAESRGLKAGTRHRPVLARHCGHQSTFDWPHLTLKETVLGLSVRGRTQRPLQASASWSSRAGRELGRPVGFTRQDLSTAPAAGTIWTRRMT
ncbi:uncharacterized protein LOC118769542 [Megalops cyprinoides]|uniref:uncharacterized protein LOC118769542 n=1 Tax=Megalops cyprinoides TaxID=118141 RepID=UPI0018649B09|nr:uncharacterized protein LOC118769542 [Megalops cyprinoides]